MKQAKKLGVIAALLAMCASGFAQTLSVPATGDDEPSKETKLVFTMQRGNSADVYRVTGITTGTSTTSSVGMSGGFGGFRGYSGVSNGVSSATGLEYAFTAPMEMTFDKGQIQLQVGTGWLSRQFIVTATGGTQEWGIKAPSTGLYYGGIAATVVGALSLSGGITLLIMSLTKLINAGPVPGVLLTVVGGLGMGGGITMTFLAKPKVTLLRTTR